MNPGIITKQTGFLRFLAAIILSGCWATIFANETTQQYAGYDIKLDPALQDLQISVCYMGAIPAYLYANADSAGKYLQKVNINGRIINRYNANTGKISLQGLVDEACMEYSVDIQSAVKEIRRPGNRNNLVRDNVIIPLAAWLWLPEEREITGNINFTFKHDVGYEVSAPWQLLSRSDTETVYRFINTPSSWGGLSTFGRFRIENVKVPGATIRLGMLGGTPAMNYDEVREWITHGALAITSAYGRFPIPSPQILVVPIGRNSRGPVPWGQVLRGGGTASHLFIDQTRPITEHKHDWTLIHELSHMFHPYLGNDGSWLAEGLASYYQNLLQARIGTLSEQRAWEKLHEGFQRGIKQTRKGITLEDAGRNRRWDGIMRIYWSGAAMALLADLALRKEGKSLDYAMSAFQQCCLPADTLWSTFDYMARLDALTETNVFTDLHNRYVSADVFPELQDAYAELGLEVVNGKLIFNDDKSCIALRQAVMSPADDMKQVTLSR